jgi:hypothetical protein
MADLQALHAFAQWVAGCSGNEKQEGRTSLGNLLQAWVFQGNSEPCLR